MGVLRGCGHVHAYGDPGQIAVLLLPSNSGTEPSRSAGHHSDVTSLRLEE